MNGQKINAKKTKSIKVQYMPFSKIPDQINERLDQGGKSTARHNSEPQMLFSSKCISGLCAGIIFYCNVISVLSLCHL